mmetsp:Transcript_27746/g.55841  ORF Transcript_27746/g.55841 Transcript_27746/m.55841 type:complete len:241 (+) Transcript_27746:736-1458(+)
MAHGLPRLFATTGDTLHCGWCGGTRQSSATCPRARQVQSGMRQSGIRRCGQAMPTETALRQYALSSCSFRLQRLPRPRWSRRSFSCVDQQTRYVLLGITTSTTSRREPSTSFSWTSCTVMYRVPWTVMYPIPWTVLYPVSLTGWRLLRPLALAMSSLSSGRRLLRGHQDVPSRRRWLRLGSNGRPLADPHVKLLASPTSQRMAISAPTCELTGWCACVVPCKDVQQMTFARTSWQSVMLG